MNIPRVMRLARQAMAKSTARCPGHRVGAVIAVGSRYVTGWAQYRRWTVMSTVQTLHAEVHALRRLQLKRYTHAHRISSTELLKDAVVAVYREAAGKPALARPCQGCLGHLKEAGIGWIAYSVPDDRQYAVEAI